MSGKTKVVTRRKPHIILEELEERVTPAGGVTVLVHGGTLTITGDNLANHITIDQDGLDAGQVRVTGFSPWFFSPDDVTTINGVDSSVVFSGVTGGVIVNLRGGDDGFAVGSGMIIPGSLSVNLGSGHDCLVMLPDAEVLGNLTVNFGSGWDAADFMGDNTIHGNLTVKGADGHDQIAGLEGFYDPPLEGITVHGNTVIADTGGSTNVWLSGTFFGPVAIKTAGFTPWDREVYDPQGQEVSLDGQFHQDVRITRGDGANDVHIENAIFDGNISVHDGNGPHSYYVLESLFRGDLSIKAGAGDGFLTVNVLWDSGEYAAVPFDVAGNLSYAAGSGDQTVQIANGAVHGSCLINLAGGYQSVTVAEVAVGAHGIADNDGIAGAGNLVIRAAGASYGETILTDVDVAGSVALNAGRGEFSFALSEVSIGGDFAARAGAGGGEFFMGHAAVDGATCISTGAGEDSVSIDNGIFTGAVTISTGRGDDEVWIQSGAGEDLAAPSAFHGPVTITTGAGWDIISVGGAYGWQPEPGAHFGHYQYAEFFGAVTVTGGSGIDELRMVGVQNVFHDVFRVSGIETIS